MQLGNVNGGRSLGLFRCAACLLAALALTGSSVAQSVSDRLPDLGGTRKPVMEGFDSRSINTPPFKLGGEPTDIGYVRPRSVTSRTFTLTNVGDKDIKIIRASSGCACTTPTLRGQVLKPGETISMPVTFTAQVDIGRVRESIKVVCEGWKFPYEVNLQGDIGYPVRFNPGGLSAVNTLAGEIVLESVDGTPFRVTAVSGQAPTFKDHDPSSTDPQTRYTILYDWQSLPAEQLPRWMVIETDHPGAELFEVRVIAPEVKSLYERGAPWSTEVSRRAFMRLPAGAPHEFTIKLTGASLKPNGVVTVSSDIPGLSAEVVSAVVGAKRGEVLATVRLIASDRGYYSGLLTFAMEGLRAPMDVMGRAVSIEEYEAWKAAQPAESEQGHAFEAPSGSSPEAGDAGGQ